MNKKEELNIPVMMFFIIGLVLAIFGAFLLKNDNFKLKIISTEGTVTGVTTSTTSDGTVEQRTVNLSYLANNNPYNATITNYGKEIATGDKMTLYYDLLSPEYVDNKRTGYIGYLSVIIGVIFVLKTGPRFIRIIKDNYL